MTGAVADVWDVVKVAFPYTNRPVEQYRPGLVVARYSHRDTPDLLWILMITSAAHRRWVGDIAISDLGKAGLPVPCVIRTAKIATVAAQEAKLVGRLAERDREPVLHQPLLTLTYRGKEASTSFFKKRSKKLFSYGREA